MTESDIRLLKDVEDGCPIGRDELYGLINRLPGEYYARSLRIFPTAYPPVSLPVDVFVECLEIVIDLNARGIWYQFNPYYFLKSSPHIYMEAFTVPRYIDVLYQHGTILETVMHNEEYDIAKLLIKAGANPNIYGRGTPALWYAVRNANIEMIALLLAHGADQDLPDTNNNNMTVRNFSRELTALVDM
jgi:hypothetical protein